MKISYRQKSNFGEVILEYTSLISNFNNRIVIEVKSAAEGLKRASSVLNDMNLLNEFEKEIGKYKQTYL